MDCYEGETFFFDRKFKCFRDKNGQVYQRFEGGDADTQENNSIEAVWCDEDAKAPGGDHYAWTYKTQIPHATFDIVEHMEGGGVSYYCRAIIFNINDLK
jgi:hypothetical protein